jgi:hypothetical protein
VKAVDYDGPLALSCDDTKLHAAWRTIWDAEKQVYLLYGGIGEPRVIASPNELRATLSKLSDKDKAVKVCLVAFDEFFCA